MYGISVSLYDKFDDLALLIDIIRHNWDDDYFVSVCSNHPDAPAKMDALDVEVDAFTHGAQVHYNPGEMTGLRVQVNKITRVYDTVSTAVETAYTHPDVDHVMHVHADAWPLSEDRVHGLVAEMYDADCPVAFKGRGLGQRWPFPVGHVMDQYFVLDADYAERVGFFDHSPLELLPDRGIHTVMTLLLLGKVGWSNVYHYTDEGPQVHWDGHSAHSVRPMMFNPDYEQVHVATEDFPDDLGRALQAHYLREWGHTAGPNVERLLDDHGRSERDLFADLDHIERSLNRDLGRWRLSVDDFGRNYRQARAFLDGSTLDRAKHVASHHGETVSSAFGAVKDRVKGALGVHQSLPAADPVGDAYPDRTFEEVYTSELRAEDFAGGYEDDLWFVER
jgi:hypothetical protein